MRRLLAVAATGFFLIAWVWARRQPPARPALAPSIELGPATPPAAFARATAVRELELPRDHGPHFDYETEWWYYTGNVAADDGRRFGFQLTFFRRGLAPGPPPAGPGLRSNQIYLAHFAVTDVSRGRHRFFERVGRGAAGLAGATAAPYRVWLEDWSADGASADGSAVHMKAAAEGFSLSLDATATKPLARHGDRGLSPKSSAPGNASYYVGYTRMEVHGQLAAGGSPIGVRGQAWFDHEWSTSALGAGAVGWDWFSLQLNDGRELMFFQIRREGGSLDPASGGTVVDERGDTLRLATGDVGIEVLRRAQSPESGSSYPVKWRIKSAAADMDLEVEGRLDDQELRASFTYWEGAVSARGKSRGRPVEGEGYVEMTGYAKSMRGIF